MNQSENSADNSTTYSPSNAPTSNTSLNANDWFVLLMLYGFIGTVSVIFIIMCIKRICCNRHKNTQVVNQKNRTSSKVTFNESRRNSDNDETQEEEYGVHLEDI